MKTGGSAFPLAYKCGINETRYTNGMTLLDWFAGQALAGACVGDFEDIPAMAHWCYQMADAMLAARDKTE